MGAVISVWSTKGGVGVTSVAAMLAIGQVERAHDVVLVDLCGDMPGLLGVEEPEGAGITDWCAMAEPTADALGRIEVDVRPGLTLLPRGRGDLVRDPSTLLGALGASKRTIVIDAGHIASTGFRRDAVAGSQTRLLVVRPCYLTLKSVGDATVEPTGVVEVREPKRVLQLGDVESAVSAPVVAQIAVDAAIARSIDAGLASSRLPRRLIRMLGHVVADAA